MPDPEKRYSTGDHRLLHSQKPPCPRPKPCGGPCHRVYRMRWILWPGPGFGTKSPAFIGNRDDPTCSTNSWEISPQRWTPGLAALRHTRYAGGCMSRRDDPPPGSYPHRRRLSSSIAPLQRRARGENPVFHSYDKDHRKFQTLEACSVIILTASAWAYSVHLID